MTETARIGLTLAGKYRITGAPTRTPFGTRQSALDLRSDVGLEVVTLPGPGNKRALQRAAHLALSVRAPGLSAVHAAEVLADGSAAVVIDPPMGVALDAWATGAGAPAVVALFFESVRALARAHRRGLVHGAICPETLRVEAGARPVLWAMGLLALQQAWFGGLRGANPAADFAAPATPTTDARADVYGLAQTFLAVGVLPEHLVSVLGRAAAVDPAVRYADAGDLAAALGIDLTDEPAPANAPLPDTRARGLDLLAGFADEPALDEDGPTVRMGRSAADRMAAVAVDDAGSRRVAQVEEVMGPAEAKHDAAVALRQSVVRAALSSEPSNPPLPRATLIDPGPRRPPARTAPDGSLPTLRVDAVSDEEAVVRADRRLWLALISAGAGVLVALLWWWRR